MGLSYFVHYLTYAHQVSKALIWEYPYAKPGKNTKRLSILKNTIHVLAVVVGFASIVFFLLGIYSVPGAVEHLAGAR